MAKKGASRGKGKPSRAKELAGDPLYTELNEIGRQLYPLEPAGLKGRRHLLKCPAVLRCSEPDPAPEQLAYLASKVLAAAIQRVRPLRDRYIAEAIFGTTDLYRGKIVAERQKELFSKHTISVNTYAERRPHALDSVMFYLNLEIPVSEPMETDVDSSVQPLLSDDVLYYVSYSFDGLARDTFLLLFAALTCLFVAKMDAEPAYSKVGQVSHRRNTLACLDHLFNALVRFWASWKTCFVEIPDDVRREALFELPDELHDRLIALGHELDECCSLDPARYDDFPDHLLTVLDHVGIHPIDIYDYIWMPWCKRELRNAQLSNIKLITTKSAAIGSILSTHLGFNTRWAEEANQMAQESLILYCGFDPGAVVIEGLSLFEHARRFFEAKVGGDYPL